MSEFLLDVLAVLVAAAIPVLVVVWQMRRMHQSALQQNQDAHQFRLRQVHIERILDWAATVVAAAREDDPAMPVSRKEHIRTMLSVVVFSSRRGLHNQLAFHESLYKHNTGELQPPFEFPEDQKHLVVWLRGLREEAGQSCEGLSDANLGRLWLE